MFIPPTSPCQLEGKAIRILLQHNTKLFFYVVFHKIMDPIICPNFSTILYVLNSPLWIGLGNQVSLQTIV